MSRTRGSLTYKYTFGIKHPEHTEDFLINFIDSKMDRGLRLRHNTDINKRTMTFEHMRLEPLMHCYDRLKRAGLTTTDIKRVA